MVADTNVLPPRETTLTERLGRLLSPAWFFAGVGAGLAGSAVLGWLLAGSVTYAPFVRFHQFISAESYYFPTASQVDRMVADVPACKITVIVGGSSRLNGAGQRPQALWSRELAARLGEGYHVLNLAVRAGGLDQIGAHAMEMAIRQGRRAIFVGDSFLDAALRPSGLIAAYRYFFFDARARGLLLPWPPRENALAAGGGTPADGPEGRFHELRLRATLNGVLAFDDLWTTVGYRFVFLPAWYAAAHSSPFRPRRRFDDGELHAPMGGYQYLDFDIAMDAVRGASRPMPAGVVTAIARSLDVLPLEVRRHSIIVSIDPSPYFTQRFDAAQLDGLRQRRRQRHDIFTAAGMPVVELGEDMTADDYVDLAHLSEAGGRKLAALVAPAVRDRALRLGYEPDCDPRSTADAPR